MEFKLFMNDGIKIEKKPTLEEKIDQQITSGLFTITPPKTTPKKIEEKKVKSKTIPMGKTKVLVLTEKQEGDEYTFTAKRVLEEGKKLGFDVYIVFIDGAYIIVKNGKRTIHNIDDKKGFEIESKNTFALIRASITKKDSWMDLLSQLEKANICCINSRTTISTCADKYRTYLKLSDYGINQPKTMLIPNTDSTIPTMKNLGVKYPVIIKTLRGTQGIGVIFIESERSLEAIVQLVYKNNDAELLIQEYIKTDFDVRVLVVGGKVLTAMKRDVIEGDFRSNYSQGGDVSEFELTEIETEQCILAAKAVNGIYVGVDFIPAKNREKDLPYFLEVNSSPGTEGIEKATGENLIKIILQYFGDPSNRFSVPIEVGYKETVSIEPFGNIIAKFDTGNSGYNVIHAEDIKESGNKVSWKYLGKEITSKIVDKAKLKTNGNGDGLEERNLVYLDITFLGTTYKDILFSLDDRSNRSSDVLLCRDFMIQLNVMVNPKRKFIVTTKYSL